MRKWFGHAGWSGTLRVALSTVAMLSFLWQAAGAPMAHAGSMRGVSAHQSAHADCPGHAHTAMGDAAASGIAGHEPVAIESDRTPASGSIRLDCCTAIAAMVMPLAAVAVLDRMPRLRGVAPGLSRPLDGLWPEGVGKPPRSTDQV